MSLPHVTECVVIYVMLFCHMNMHVRVNSQHNINLSLCIVIPVLWMLSCSIELIIKIEYIVCIGSGRAKDWWVTSGVGIGASAFPAVVMSPGLKC